MVAHISGFECEKVFHVDLKAHFLGIIVLIPSTDLRVIRTHFLRIRKEVNLNSLFHFLVHAASRLVQKEVEIGVSRM